MVRRLVSFLTAGVIAGAAGLACAGGGSVMGNGGATEITQILNNTELVGQTAQQIQLVNQGIQQVNQMIKDAQDFGGASLSVGQVMGVYRQVTSAVQNAQSLAYGTVNAMTNFKALNPSFSAAGALDPTTIIRRNQITLQAIQNAISAGNSDLASATSEQGRLEALGDQINSPAGRQQALITGNQVQYEVLQQLRAMRIYNQQASQAQQAYMAAQVSGKASQSDEAAERQFRMEMQRMMK